MGSHKFKPIGSKPRPTTEHMPFFGHRTVAEVIEDENRNAILRSLGR